MAVEHALGQELRPRRLRLEADSAPKPATSARVVAEALEHASQLRVVVAAAELGAGEVAGGAGLVGFAAERLAVSLDGVVEAASLFQQQAQVDQRLGPLGQEPGGDVEAVRNGDNPRFSR